MSNLVIVESCGKVKTIKQILGKNYTVIATGGHIIDLSPKHFSINIDAATTDANSTQHHIFKPEYYVLGHKVKFITQLRKHASKATKIYIASDADREGEMIAWCLHNQLQKCNVPIVRVKFIAITEQAILDAIAHPTIIDQSLVQAQKTRRLLDRIIGFKLTPLLSRKSGLKISIGRVQAAVLEVIAHNNRKYADSTSLTSTLVPLFMFESCQAQGDVFATEDIARKYLAVLVHCQYSLGASHVTYEFESPPLPFTTASLQQQAYYLLGLTTDQTMEQAQVLYENGFITYMRTDATRLCKSAIEHLKKHIKPKLRATGNTSSGSSVSMSQGAHEAIRPTEKNTDSLPRDLLPLYQLITKRAIQSLMTPAKYEVTTTNIDIDFSEVDFSKYEITAKELASYQINITHRRLVSGGFKEYGNDSNTTYASHHPLTPIFSGSHSLLVLQQINVQQQFEDKKLYYDEGSLIKAISSEELNIGRPSTYASILSKLINSGYITKIPFDGIPLEIISLTATKQEITQSTATIRKYFQKSALMITEVGKFVNEYLNRSCQMVSNVHLTAQLEFALDSIAVGHTDWQTVLDEFYVPFVNTIDAMTQAFTQRDCKHKVTLGEDATGMSYKCYYLANGPVIVVYDQNNKKQRQCYIRPPHELESLTLAQAQALLTTYPKQIGIHRGKAVNLHYGIYGKYVRWHNKTFKLLGTIDNDHAEKMIRTKLGTVTAVTEK